MSFGTTETMVEDRLSVKEVLSFPFPEYYIEENISAAMRFVPREDDVVLSSYPLAISTWVIQSIWKVLNLGCENPDFDDLLNSLYCTEAVGTAHLDDVESPRLIRCNLPFWLTNRNSRAKHIYITRNPRDTLVANYLNYVVDNSFSINFENYFQDFLRGLLPYGNYFDHVRSWYANTQSNILYLNYENMHVNPKRSILQIASFLGPKHYEMCLDDSVMDYVLQFSDLDYRILTVEGDGLLNCLAPLVEKHSLYYQSVHKKVLQRSLLLNSVTLCVGIWKHYEYITLPLINIIDQKMVEEFSKEIYKYKGDINLLAMLHM